MVSDFKSTNGTYINAERIGRGDWPAYEGDIVSLGGIDFEVVAIPESSRSGPDERPAPPPVEGPGFSAVELAMRLAERVAGEQVCGNS
jgi:pSer/pThr/pTyr-binding forkhead associated (FHA) protein